MARNEPEIVTLAELLRDDPAYKEYIGEEETVETENVIFEPKITPIIEKIIKDPKQKVLVAININDATYDEVSLSFINVSDKPITLARPRVEAPFDGNFFTFEPEAPYLGKTVKRVPYEEKDYITLQPNEKYDANAFNLNELYGLDKSGYEYFIRYEATHPLTGTTRMTKLRSEDNIAKKDTRKLVPVTNNAEDELPWVWEKSDPLCFINGGIGHSGPKYIVSSNEPISDETTEGELPWGQKKSHPMDYVNDRGPRIIVPNNGPISDETTEVEFEEKPKTEGELPWGWLDNKEKENDVHTSHVSQPELRSWENVREDVKKVRVEQTNKFEKITNPEHNNKLWVTLSTVSTGVALLGTIIWVIPVLLFAILGIVFGIVSLKTKEALKTLAITSIALSGVAVLYAILFYIIVLTFVTIFTGILSQ